MGGKGGARTVVLLALVLVDCSDYLWAPKERVVSALCVEDVVDEAALACVRGENRDCVRGVVEQTHVHEERDGVLGLAQVDDPVRCGLGFASAFIVGDVDELVFVLEACVGSLEVGVGEDGREVCEGWVAPLVEFCDRGSRAALLVEHDGWDPEADEALEEGLLQVCVLSECEVLDDGRVLEVVTAKDDALKRQLAILRILQGKRDEVLNLCDLSSFFHDYIIVVETKRGNLLSTHGSVGRSHRNDASLLDKKIICLVARVSQNLKRTNVLELQEDLLDMTSTALNNVKKLFAIRIRWEQRLWRIREVVLERKLRDDLLDAGIL